MAGSLTDVFSQASSGTAPLASTLTAQKAVGASSLSAAAATGWATAANSLMYFKLYQATSVATSQGTLLLPVSGTETLWKGLVSGLNVNNLTLTSGTDQLYPIGSIIEPMFTSSQMDAMFNGLIAQHSQLDGSHTNITTSSVTNAGSYVQSGGNFTVPNGVIQPQALSTGAITLGYQQITSNLSTASNSFVAATGLSVTVSVPAGGRKIKITVWSEAIYSSVTGGILVGLWDGAVNTGTQISQSQVQASNSTQAVANMTMMAVQSPSAGSKTYNVGYRSVNGNTCYIEASPSFPAFILVEAI